MAERGETSRRAAEVAALDTRRAKDYGVSAGACSPTGPPGRGELGFGPRELAGDASGAADEREPDPRRDRAPCSRSSPRPRA